VSFRYFDWVLTRAATGVDPEAPGVTEMWSVKDVVAHLIAHEHRTIEELRYAKRGERLPIKHAENDSFNDGAVYACRVMPFEMVREQRWRSYERVVAMIESLDEADFDPQSNVVKMLDDTIDGAVANNTYEHYNFHGAQIEEWLEDQGL
ncbi:MAG: DinB family protein, partial [Chloroflexota bacterium]